MHVGSAYYGPLTSHQLRHGLNGSHWAQQQAKVDRLTESVGSVLGGCLDFSTEPK